MKDKPCYKKVRQALVMNDNLDWYERGMLLAYLELGTYRKIEKVTGIKYISAFHTIAKAIKKTKL